MQFEEKFIDCGQKAIMDVGYIGCQVLLVEEVYLREIQDLFRARHEEHDRLPPIRLIGEIPGNKEVVSVIVSVNEYFVAPELQTYLVDDDQKLPCFSECCL